MNFLKKLFTLISEDQTNTDSNEFNTDSNEL